MKIFILKLPKKLDETEFKNIEKVLTNSKKEKISKIKHNSEIIKTVFSELIIKYVLFNEFNIEPSSIQFEFNEFGKPSIRNMDDFHYDILNFYKVAVCSMNKNFPPRIINIDYHIILSMIV